MPESKVQQKELEMNKMNDPNDLVIVSAARTPFGRFGGMLTELHSSTLGTQ